MKKNDLFGQWRSLAKKEQRFLLILAACLLFGVLLMSWNSSSPEAAVEGEQAQIQADLSPELYHGEEGDQLEKKLEELLCQVKGAGSVQVALSYADSARAVYAYDESTRTTTGKDSSTQDTEARIVEINEQPVLVSTTSPRILGVVVVAEGGGDPLVKERLYQALSSLLGINAAQIAIIEAEGSSDYEN